MSRDPGADDHDAAGARTALVALYVALFLVGAVWTTTRVYVLNFSTAGPNATATMAAFLVSGWVLVPLGLAGTSARSLYLGSSGLAVVAVLGTFLPDPLLSGVFGGLLVAACTALLVGLLSDLRERIAVGAAAGVVVHHGVRSWFETVPPHATDVGRGLVLGGALAGVLAVWRLTERESLDAIEWDTLRVSASPLAAFLLVEVLFLGFPGSVALWALRPYPATLAASVVGLVAGAGLVAWRGPPGRVAIPAWGAVLVLSTVALVYWPATPSLVAAAPAQAAAVALLAAGSRRIASRPLWRTTAGVVVVQVLGVALLFLFVSAVNWAFMPAPLDDITRDRAGLFLVALPALFAVTVGVAVLRPGEAGTSPGRRSVLGSAAAGAVAVAGPFVPRSPAEAGSEGPPYRVLTYNIHQYLAGEDGHYNLDEVRRVIRESGAEIIGLQETEGGRITTGHLDGVRWLAEELGVNAVNGTATGEGGYGVALLSPWPIEKLRTVHLPVGDSPTRPALVATVDAPGGEVPVLVTHFQTEKPGHRQADEARRIVEIADEFDRAVVLGDFNTVASEGKEPYRILDDAFTDAWTAAGNSVGSGPTYSAADPVRRIDYVWLKGAWDVGGAATVGNPDASDHLGVVAEVDPES